MTADKGALRSWRPGQRVARRANVYDPTSRLMVGEVLARYSEDGYPELYSVRWDVDEFGQRGGVRGGYLRHGLQEPPE